MRGLLLSVAVPLIALLALRAALLARRRARYPVRELPGFLSDEECAHLIARAEPLLRTSKVVVQGRVGLGDAGRRSATAFIDHGGDAIIEGIKRRVAALTDTDFAQQEPIQVTHYGDGQFYERHFDSLCANGVDAGAPGDRAYTVIFYLNDDYRGGATYFPSIRRRVRPERGKAVLFGNLNRARTAFEPLSIHAGERVRGGEKWLSNQWIRERRASAASDVRTPRAAARGKRRK
ncbi:MAG TPA: 2OG-Fe(II) oxygenase [Myxococcota bacterium]|nr:2OG-Fe(II) oxygenase [Myxococcota bacterium]